MACCLILTECLLSLLIWIVNLSYNLLFCAVSLSHVLLFLTPWTIVLQASLSMEFSRQEYWSELSFPTPGNLSNPGIKPCHWLPGKPKYVRKMYKKCILGTRIPYCEGEGAGWKSIVHITMSIK